MTHAEKKHFSSGALFALTPGNLLGENKHQYCGIHIDPLCFIYKNYVDSQLEDDLQLKIGMANLLFTEEALSMMNEKLEELAEERREMEYQEWLHAD